MSKQRFFYICSACGHQEPKWLGRCPACQQWSTLQEGAPAAKNSRAVAQGQPPVALSQVTCEAEIRTTCGIAELDRVLGGGLVQGSLVLVGGDPGIGKSTLLLQATTRLAQRGIRGLYVSAEESLKQIKLRADRLGCAADTLYLLAEANLEAVLEAIESLEPQVLVLDSVQTVRLEEAGGPAGTLAQVRAVTAKLTEVAKSRGLATFLVGHVTKEGAIAGPKVMEHMVDTVLYFEGERAGEYRILRAHKNRFGSAQEIGVFEMQAGGLQGVADPSALFLSQRAEGPGAVVVTSLRGSRPILLEVQALTTACPFGSPRRTAVGFDAQRLAILCAVIERHVGLPMSSLDVYLNVAGGIRVGEPAVDLGVILALVSADRDKPVPPDTVAVGEIGLGGEVRAVSQLPCRIQEAATLGFGRVLVPSVDLASWRGPPPQVHLSGVRTVAEALDEVGLHIGSSGSRSRRAGARSVSSPRA